MSVKYLTLSFGFLALAGASVGAQSQMDDVEIEAQKITDQIFMLEGRGGNIGLCIGDDGAFLVDDQFAPLTDKIRAAVAGVTDGEIRFVVNTHWHGDHTGGNENLGQAGALIVAHENVRKRLDPAQFKEVMGRTQQAPPAALPVVTFPNSLTFYWNDEKIDVFHLQPAHTDGDSVIHFTKANVFHMGDLFFNGRYPFIDVDSGGGVEGVIAAADRVLDMSDPSTRIIPGHGELSGPEGLRAYRDMLVTVRERVRILKDGGKSEGEVVAAAPTQDLDGKWGDRSERFVRAVYRTLAGRR